MPILYENIGANPWGIAIGVIIALPLLYSARRPVHMAITSATRLIRRPFQIASHYLRRGAEDLRQRNRMVLLAQGQQDTSQHIEREFERVDAAIRRDLQGFPVLQRKLLDEITTIEEDYQQSREVPPLPPEWAKAVAPILRIKSDGGDRIIDGVLESLKKTVAKGQDQALSEYRHSCEKRHKILSQSLPFWRSVDTSLKSVDKRLGVLTERASTIDSYMDRYEEITKKTDRAEHTLASSAFIQLFISTFVLMIALGGTVINFHLIALPMSEMVGGGSYIGQFRTADVAALVIILVEATMGLFFMESIQITHMFPKIGHMSERTRRRFMMAAFGLLFALASIEAALAFLREQIAADNQALTATLAASAPPILLSLNSWIPTAGQMVLGFILPFALAFVALPLESFVYASRTVGGITLVTILRAGALLLNITGQTIQYAGSAVNALYDLVIFLPLIIERGVTSAAAQRATPVAQNTTDLAGPRGRKG